MKHLLSLLILAAAAFAGAVETTSVARTVYGPEEIAAGKIGTRCLFSGGKLSGTLKPGRFSDGTSAAVWEVSGEPGKGNWSCLGFQFPYATDRIPIGFRIRVELDRDTVLGLEDRVNAQPEKGFWHTRRLGRGRLPLAAGIRTIEMSWADLKTPAKEWSGINAVVLSVNEPVELKIAGFELLYPEDVSAAGTLSANWFDAGQTALNPVARPYDKLVSVFCCQGKGWNSRLGELPHPATGLPAPCWSVDAPEGAKGWAVYGFGFADRVEPAPAGLRFVITLAQPAELTFQPVTGFNARRSKGFYSAKNAGKARTFQLPAGEQSVSFRWSEFGLAPEVAGQVNGVKLSGLKPGERLFFERIDLLFADLETANTYRAVTSRRLKTLQQVLIDALAARGVDWRETFGKLDTEAAESRIWIGMQLSAQREQLDFFRRLAAANALSTTDFPGLEQERAALVARGKNAGAGDLKNETEALQRKIDAVIDRILAALPVEKRRFRYRADDRKFHYPDGRSYRMFGPHFFRSQYRPGPQQWRRWDLRYLAGLGFNGIRVQIRWAQLEPVQGKFDPAYLDLIKGILAEAERYGFGVSIDLHWAYPDWFNRGRPGLENTPRANPHNSYHWPEALIDTWERLGREFAAYPNIVAFEVPTNETNICASPGSFTDMPNLQRSWNEFLRRKYGTREALDAAWRAAGEQYGLAEDENWENASIRPLGFQNDPSVDAAFANNPRLYDHLCFAAETQTVVSGGIVKALRKSIPDAVGMFQRTIGDVWDKSPVPLDYLSIITCVGENVIPGTHYGMGGISARKAATLSLGSYDSEQQMEGNSRAVERHIALGLGFCPFAFHYRGGGGMLLADDDWHLKPEVGFLPLMAEKIRNFEPVSPSGPAVAVIVNSRLEATTGRLTGKLPEALEKRGFQVKVFDSLRIVAEPSLLDGCALAITTGNYLDSRLLDVLRKFPGQTLLFGRLDIDAYARTQEEGLPGRLLERALLVKSLPVRTAGQIAGTIDLTGSWDFVFRAGDGGKGIPELPGNVGVFESVTAPGMWGEEGITGSLKYRIGDGWYRRSITLPPEWKDRPLQLQIGAIDDIDWVFWNGKLIGHTGEDVANYWQTPRNYSIDPALTRYDAPNELYICVRNLRGNGGIARGPLLLTGRQPGTIRFGTETLPAGCSGNAALLSPEQLADGAEILAELEFRNSPARYAALVRQGKFYWYVKDLELNLEEPADSRVLDTVLDSLN